MMTKIYNLLTIFLCSSLLLSCNSEISDNEDVDDGTHKAISFSSSTDLDIGEQHALTKATSLADFPNNGNIGVVAANYVDPSSPDPINWIGYPDISNAAAKATAFTNNTFSFAFNPVKYWPFDGSELVFIAYSPLAADGSAVELNDDYHSLNLTLQDDMPDVLYASNNSLKTPYTKASGIVDLGAFRHALSQLTIVVNGDANVKIQSLSVDTYKYAELDLLGGDNGITEGSDIFSYPFISTDTDFSDDNPYKKTVLVYPGSEDNTVIHLVLIDNSISYPFDLPAAYFLKDGDPSNSVTLERGKNTTLTITVSGVELTTNIHLQGQISPWIDRGDFGVIIE